MKNFVKENWYKLMIGSSLFIFSVGFFINSVSPVYSSNTNKEKTDIVNQGFGRYFQDAILPSGQRIGDVKSVDLATSKPIDITISDTEDLPSDTEELPNEVKDEEDVIFQDIVKDSEKSIGTKYCYGGNDPNEGIDCRIFV